MESIAALGVACNFLQLIDGSLKIMTTFKQAYHHDWTKEQ